MEESPIVVEAVQHALDYAEMQLEQALFRIERAKAGQTTVRLSPNEKQHLVEEVNSWIHLLAVDDDTSARLSYRLGRQGQILRYDERDTGGQSPFYPGVGSSL